MLGGRLCRSFQSCKHLRCSPCTANQSSISLGVTAAAYQKNVNHCYRGHTNSDRFLHGKRYISTCQRLCKDNPVLWFDRAVALADQEVQALQEKVPDYVENITEKRKRNRKAFHYAIDRYIEQEKVYRRGHSEFIYKGLSKMKDLDLHRDLECYKELMKCFPKDVMVARTTWQIEFMHFPKQQQCCIDVMDQMERYGVVADRELGNLLLSITGPKSHAFRKYRRHLYWARKFNNLNPYHKDIPRQMPDDPLELAVLALKKMAIDLENKITVWQTTEVEEDPLEDTFIASAQSPAQQELLQKHPTDVPLYVEGGFIEYLKYKSATYFVLKAEADPDRFKSVDPSLEEEEEEELMEFSTPFDDEEPKELALRPSDHEQEDGTIFAMCVTGTGSKDSLISWIRYLQKTNPNLEHTKVVFTLRSPDAGYPLLEEKKHLIEDGNYEKEMKQS